MHALQAVEAQAAPVHVAIIMDGNGRWARARGLPRTEGHRRGAQAARRAVTGAAELGISYLTLFGFSSENWRRPATEIDDLMGLLRYYLRSEVDELHRQGARLRILGDRSRFSDDIVRLIDEAERRTDTANPRINLAVCLSYGARSEIVQAARALAREVRDGRLAPDDIDEAAFSRHLLTHGMPDPDLLIRTSGEKRLSNFLLWQSAYAELVFIDCLWPDFTKRDLEDAIREFHRRERRYGDAR
ncbi:MAG: isoprenyl transferase [Rhodospirillaceae bacterium]|nr:isoprenyl transferase [Rhodospirillaceae bacterium]